MPQTDCKCHMLHIYSILKNMALDFHWRSSTCTLGNTVHFFAIIAWRTPFPYLSLSHHSYLDSHESVTTPQTPLVNNLPSSGYQKLPMLQSLCSDWQNSLTLTKCLQRLLVFQLLHSHKCLLCSSLEMQVF